jgi:NAD(P)-dependent dehydrogenase (short-subunit alcohol dehydrogenase family)
MNEQFIENLYNLKGKTVLVTGATGQLGFEICKAFDAVGAMVIGTDKILNENKCVSSPRVEYRLIDIAVKKNVGEAFEKIADKHKSIDVLINNAGVSVFEPFEERAEESFDWVLDVNLKGTFFCIQEYVKTARMLAKKGGAIVNISSMYAVISPDYRIYTDCLRKNSEVYGATKAGILQMTKYFAVHLAQDQIRVNAVSPGGIFNPESPQGEDFIRNYSFRCPMGRMADAKEMLGAILFLASDAASYTTGQNIIIDGGMTCW